MSEDETYNGWSNWDTWELFNWISSDEDSWRTGRSMADRGERQLEEWAREFVPTWEAPPEQAPDCAAVDFEELSAALLEA